LLPAELNEINSVLEVFIAVEPGKPSAEIFPVPVGERKQFLGVGVREQLKLDIRFYPEFELIVHDYVIVSPFFPI
jgi:hypothetical protein